MKSFLSIVLTLGLVSQLHAYTDLTNVEVHDKLLNKEDFFLLDVREIAEYETKHMAEPEGFLPLTPVNLPFSSQVLQSNFHRLPTDKDIIVYCHSGGRSAAASAFLEAQGFTRIFNMLGGIANWPFEIRDGGFGDHSGKWVTHQNTMDIEVFSPEQGDHSSIVISAGAVQFPDSTYIEIHYASNYADTLTNTPVSSIKGLYRLSVLDPQGFERSLNDTAAFTQELHFNFQPSYPIGIDLESADKNLTCLQDSLPWVDLSFVYNDSVVQTSNKEFHKWYNLEIHPRTVSTEVVSSDTKDFNSYPNPFSINIQFDCDSFEIFTLNGRQILREKGAIWTPDSNTPKGIYWVRTTNKGLIRTEKVVYQ